MRRLLWNAALVLLVRIGGEGLAMGSTLMAQILPFVRRCKVFSPDATSAMGEAYDKAIGTIHPDAESQFVVHDRQAHNPDCTERC